MKTAEEILKENTGHAHGLMEAMVIKSMKEFALEVAKEALDNAYESTKNTLQEFAFKREGQLSKCLSESILSHDNIPELC